MSNLVPFFASLFLLFYKSKRLKSIKNTNYVIARKFGNVFRFIDDLNAKFYGNEYENHYYQIYPLELILKMENTSYKETNSSDFHLKVSEYLL